MQPFSLSICVCLSLRFLRCSPFDEYKLWKAQVDNGSRRGRERLNLLTRSLLLRRTKDQQDSTGQPLVGGNTHLGLLQEPHMWILALNGGLPGLLTSCEFGQIILFITYGHFWSWLNWIIEFQVSLPNRTCEVHRIKLSQDEQAVYDVVFAQSR